jgi:hypothetical protein
MEGAAEEEPGADHLSKKVLACNHMHRDETSSTVPRCLSRSPRRARSKATISNVTRCSVWSRLNFSHTPNHAANHTPTPDSQAQMHTVPHPPLIRHDIRVQPDLLPHSSPCRGRLARESSTASHQSRAPRTECRAVPQHLNPTGLVQVSLGCPFGHNAEQSCATTSTMGSRATRRDHIRIRVHVRVRPPCSSLQRRPPRRSCS